MTIRIKQNQPGKVKLILFFLIILICHTYRIHAQDPQLSQDEFNSELRSSLSANNDQKSLLLIKNNRLFVKPFVDGLIQESIYGELKGNVADSKKISIMAEKAAEIFENTFREESLSIAVGYLASWSTEQKRLKLEADSLYALGTRYRLDRETEKAVEYLKKALVLYESIRDERGQAEVLGGIGAAYYGADFDTCLSYYQEALIMREKVDDRALMGNTLNSLGSVNLSYLEDYSRAIDYYEKAEAIRHEIGDSNALRTTRRYKAIAYKNYAEMLRSTGKYLEALEKLAMAQKLYEQNDDLSGIGDILSRIGFVYTNLGDYNTAVEKVNEAVKIMKEENDLEGLAGVYNHFGIVLQAAGRSEKALDYYNSALEIYEELNDTEGALPVLNNLGTLFYDKKDYIKAEVYYKRGLKASQEIDAPDEEANYLLNLANDQVLLGKLDESLANFNAAMEVAESLNSPELRWKITAGMAENYEQRGDPDRSVELNDSALKILDGIRNTIQDNELKAYYMASERFVYEDIIDMLGRMNEKQPDKNYDLLSFEYAERSKSRAFLDMLGESLKISKSQSGKNPEDEREDLFDPRPVTLSELQELSPDQNYVFLEYYVGDSSSCLWVVTGNDHRLFMLPGREKLRPQIETIRFGIQDPRQDISDFFVNAASTLYDLLVKPAEPYLTKKSSLIIIPDGILNYLPFEVLLTGETGNSQTRSYSDLPYLIRKYPVSYAQSASVLESIMSNQEGRRKVKSADRKLMAFGDPAYEQGDNPSALQGGKLSRLEYSRQEIEKIAEFFKSGNCEIYSGSSATEENIKGKNLRDFNYLHFATHGYINEDEPGLSSLVLTRDSLSAEDGLLQSSEIFNLNLNADLVVLSACQTGLGKLVRGEGMVGLTRAFMYAGTPSVLASLWSVSDMSTATLMGDFYRNLITRKLNKTDALRRAQLAMLSDNQFAHPFYWAPFIMIGDWR